MQRIDITHLLLVAWGAVNAVLIVLIGNEVGWGQRLHGEMPAAKVLAADAVTVDLLGEFTLPMLEKRYQGTLARPLFVSSRRPAPPPPPPPPPPMPTMKKGQFQLVGVMMLPDTSFVWLRDAATGKTRKLEKGSTINGMLLQDVEPEQVTLTQYDDAEVVRMKVQASPAAPSTGAQGGAAAPAGAGAKPPESSGQVSPIRRLRQKLEPQAR